MKVLFGLVAAATTIATAGSAAAHDWRHHGYSQTIVIEQHYQSRNRPSYRQYRTNNADALGVLIFGGIVGAVVGGIVANAGRQQAVQNSDVVTTPEGKVFAKCYGNLPSIPKIHQCLPGAWQELRYADQ